MTPPQPPTLPPLPRLFWALGAAVAVTLVVLALLLRRAPPVAGGRIAVAVFVNQTGDSTLESLGTMAADWITRGLGETSLKDVLDIGASYAHGRDAKGVPTDPRVYGIQNGAALVVSGSYTLATDTLVVTAALQDAASGRVLLAVAPVAVPATVPTRALVPLREEVMTALDGLGEVGRRSQSPIHRSSPPSPVAYEAFVDGQAAYWQGRPAEARSLLERAAWLDSTFLPASTWLGFLGANGFGCEITDSVALALDPQRQELAPFDRVLLDLSLARCRNDWNDAARLAGELAELKPRSTFAEYTAGFFALASGRLRDARDAFARIDPDRDLGWLPDSAKAIYWRDYGATEHFLGDYATELAQAEQQIQRFPNLLLPRLIAIRALAGLGRRSQTRQALEALGKLSDESAPTLPGRLTPGFALYLTAAELRVHGDTAGSRIAARRAVDWYERSGIHRLGLSRYERYYYMRALLLVGRVDKAALVSTDVPASDSTDILYLGLRGVIAARQSKAADARAIDERLGQMGDSVAPSAASLQRARVMLALGDKPAALVRLDSAATGTILRLAMGIDLHLDPLFDLVRSDPRFQRLIRKGA